MGAFRELNHFAPLPTQLVLGEGQDTTRLPSARLAVGHYPAHHAQAPLDATLRRL